MGVGPEEWTEVSRGAGVCMIGKQDKYLFLFIMLQAECKFSLLGCWDIVEKDGEAWYRLNFSKFSLVLIGTQMVLICKMLFKNLQSSWQFWASQQACEMGASVPIWQARKPRHGKARWLTRRHRAGWWLRSAPHSPSIGNIGASFQGLCRTLRPGTFPYRCFALWWASSPPPGRPLLLRFGTLSPLGKNNLLAAIYLQFVSRGQELVSSCCSLWKAELNQRRSLPQTQRFKCGQKPQEMASIQGVIDYPNLNFTKLMLIAFVNICLFHFFSFRYVFLLILLLN